MAKELHELDRSARELNCLSILGTLMGVQRYLEGQLRETKAGEEGEALERRLAKVRAEVADLLQALWP